MAGIGKELLLHLGGVVFIGDVDKNQGCTILFIGRPPRPGIIDGVDVAVIDSPLDFFDKRDGSVGMDDHGKIDFQRMRSR